MCNNFKKGLIFGTILGLSVGSIVLKREYGFFSENITKKVGELIRKTSEIVGNMQQINKHY